MHKWIRVLCRIALLVPLLADTAAAAGFGGIEVRSALGQPLRATIPLLGSDTGDYSSRCARVRVESLDGALVLTPAVELVRTGQALAMQIRTPQNINELALNVIAALDCGEPIQRSFQILLDPVLAPTDVMPARLPVANPPAPAATASAEATSRRHKPPPQAAPPARKKQISAQPAARQTRSVLRLSAPEDEAEAPSLRLRLSSGLSSPPSRAREERLADLRAEQRRLALADDGEEVVLRARRMIDALQSELAGLQSEIKTLRTETERMQQENRREQAELESMRERSLNWVIGLGGLIIICFGAIAWLMWRFVGMQKTAGQIPWNEFDTLQGTETGDSEFGASVFHPAVFENTIAPDGAPSQMDKQETDVHPAPERAQLRAQPAPVAHATKAEEISDVMELVEAWMALNDPAKVLELLKPFSEVERPHSPLAWICLLDVYRALGDREKYEAILRRIRKLYNVKLASWEEYAGQAGARALADYPHVIERIVTLWKSDAIRSYLDRLLHDNRSGERDGFDLPVYRDLLRLIALVDDPCCDRSQPSMDPRAYAILFAPQELPKYINPSYERALLERPAEAVESAGDGGEEGEVGELAVASEVPVAQGTVALPAASTTAAAIEEESELSPVAVKLHLAQAYRDIGDTEGAVLLLEEVIEHGTPEQAETARVMLGKLNRLYPRNDS